MFQINLKELYHILFTAYLKFLCEVDGRTAVGRWRIQYLERLLLIDAEGDNHVAINRDKSLLIAFARTWPERSPRRPYPSQRPRALLSL